MAMKFIDYVGLRDRGIPDSKITIWRKERESRFPRRTRFSAKYCGWPVGAIDAYLMALAAGHDETTATAIAERAAQRRGKPRDHFSIRHVFIVSSSLRATFPVNGCEKVPAEPRKIEHDLAMPTSYRPPHPCNRLLETIPGSIRSRWRSIAQPLGGRFCRTGLGRLRTGRE